VTAGADRARIDPVRVEMEAVLSAPPARVWAALVDWERQPDWMRDADRVRVLTPQRDGIGVRVAVETRLLGVRAFTEELEVIGWERSERLAVRHVGPVRGVGEWRLRPVPEGTNLTWIEDVALAIPIGGDLAARVYAPFLRRLMRGGLDGLRRSLDAS
jgi:uncharacterized protein YndB with AHSA1/START domain